MKTIGQWLTELHQVCEFQTDEGAKAGKASTSKLRRWLQNHAIQINGETSHKWDEPMDFPIHSVILFPKNTVAPQVEEEFMAWLDGISPVVQQQHKTFSRRSTLL